MLVLFALERRLGDCFFLWLLHRLLLFQARHAYVPVVLTAPVSQLIPGEVISANVAPPAATVWISQAERTVMFGASNMRWAYLVPVDAMRVLGPLLV